MATDVVYGFPCVTNPNDFSPDYECCTEKEIASWKAAVEAWDRGERGTETVTNKDCETLFSEDGKMMAHITRTNWGIGINTVEWDEVSYERHTGS